MKFVMVGRDSDWNTAFAVEEKAAFGLTCLLNTDDDSDWIIITDPLDADQIPVTLASWRADGIIQ